MNDDVTQDLFHCCAVTAYATAMAEGKHTDSEYVKRLTYGLYERELAREKADR